MKKKVTFLRKQPIQQSAPAMRPTAKKAAPAVTKQVRGETLSRKQVKELTDKLMGLREQLTNKISGKAGHFNVGTAGESLTKGDDAEVAEKQRASNAALQELDFLKGRLALVERALKKVARGDYGICEESDEPIGFERLTVVPWARYAVHVQELRERRLREFKVNRLRSEV